MDYLWICKHCGVIYNQDLKGTIRIYNHLVCGLCNSSDIRIFKEDDFIRIGDHLEVLITKLIDLGAWKYSWHLDQTPSGRIDFMSKDNLKKITEVLARTKLEMELNLEKINLVENVLREKTKQIE